jgi:hypothetical protein
LATKSLSKALELTTNEDKIEKVQGNPLQVVVKGKEKSLTVLLVWLMSQKKHIDKYTKFYLDQGFDVLVVRCTPWDLLWPVKGSQVVAGELLSFLDQNPAYSKTLLHGFSVGCYLWGEVLTKMSKDIPKYKPAMNRIKGQIWDSPVDYEETPIGVPKSIFPTNAFLRTCLEKYVRFHMKTFQESATKYHLESTRQFFNSIVTAPALFLFSLKDPMVNITSVERVRDIWRENGAQVHIRVWESSPHVGILQRYPEEYRQEIINFLDAKVFPKKIDDEETIEVKQRRAQAAA